MSNNVAITSNILLQFAQAVGVCSEDLLVPEDQRKKVEDFVKNHPDVAQIMSKDNFRNSKTIEEIEKAGEKKLIEFNYLYDKGFKVLDSDDSRVISHEDLKNWIWKGTKEYDGDGRSGVVEKRAACVNFNVKQEIEEDVNDEKEEIKIVEVIEQKESIKAEIEDHPNLCRPMISCKMKNIIKEKNLKRIDVARDYFVLNPNAKESAPLEEQLLVFSENAHVIGGQLTGKVFLMLEPNEQIEIIRDVCIFIKESKIVDNHLGNFQFPLKDGVIVGSGPNDFPSNPNGINLDDLEKIEKKLVVIDTELHGKNIPDEEKVKLGLQNFKNTITELYKNGHTKGELPEHLESVFNQEFSFLSTDENGYCVDDEDEELLLNSVENTKVAGSYLKASQLIIEKNKKAESIDKANESENREARKSLLTTILLAIFGFFGGILKGFEGENINIDETPATMIPVLI